MKPFSSCFDRKTLTKAATVLIAIVAIAGCATMDKLNPFSKSSNAKESAAVGAADAGAGDKSPFFSQSKSGYVRLEPIEARAAPNDQPSRFTTTQIRAVLAQIKTAKDGEQLFNEDELNEIAAPIAAALSRAGPREDVAFAVAGKRGSLSLITTPAVTSGRVFYKNGALNIIFGEMRAPASDQLVSTGWLQSYVLREFPAGSRARASQNAAVAADANVAYAAGNRRDWVAVAAQGIPLPLAATRAAPTPVGAPSAGPAGVAPAVNQGGVEQDLERRLTLMKNLRDKGLITEEEYNEKRKEALKNL